MLRRIMQCVVLCLFASTALADDIVLQENFDDPILEGWAITNNSTPGGSTGWFLGNSGVFPAQSGAPDSYVAANFEGAPLGGTIDNWLFMPVVDLTSVLELTFWTRANGALPDRLEIYGTTAGASTNTADYTLLFAINPSLGADFPTDWTEFSLLFGGDGATSGRFAFRYSIDDTSINGDYIGIDTITVAHAPEPATVALLALALVAIAWTRRPRRAPQR